MSSADFEYLRKPYTLGVSLLDTTFAAPREGVLLTQKTQFCLLPSHMGQLEDWPQSDLVLGVDTEFESLDKLARELDVSEATLQSRKVKILSREGERWHRFGSMLGL